MDSNSPKLALEIMYDGSRFHGWQVQKNANSVQSTLQDAFFSLLGTRPDISGCSRTDSGVHANSYICHTDSYGIKLSPDKLPSALNSKLRDSGISVKNAKLMPSDFHSRYSCTAKEYIYKIWNANYSNPFLQDKALFFPRKLDFETNAFLFDELCGTHDFRCFMAKGSKNEENTVRTIKYFDYSRDGELITLRVCADGFLYNMVRIIAGTLLELCTKPASRGDITHILESNNRQNAGDTAPGYALYLNRIFYGGNQLFTKEETQK